MARVVPPPKPTISKAFEQAIANKSRQAKSNVEGPSQPNPRQFQDPRAAAAKVAALSAIPGIRKGQNIQGSYRVEGKKSVSQPFPSAGAAQSRAKGNAEVVFTPRGNTAVARNQKTGRPLPVKGR